MFESAELGHEVPDAQYKKEAAELRYKLLDTQYELLADGSIPVVVLVNGIDGAGKGETVNLFNEWMDPRHIRSHAFGPRTDVEAARPPMWRFWHVLPPRGKIGILFGSWYTDPIVSHVIGHTSEAQLSTDIDRIRRFEKMLTDENAVIVKLWFHLTKKQQRKRLKELEEDKSTAWRVTKTDWNNHEHYDQYRGVTERVLRETSTGEAPWVVIDGWDANYRSLAAGRTLLAAMRARLDARKAAAASAKSAKSTKAPKKKAKGPAVAKSVSPFGSVDTSGILRDLPFTERLGKEKYGKRIGKVQGRLANLARTKDMTKDHAVVVVFEGMDAAGKGGSIRRITQSLDARHYEVIPIAAPTDEERAQPYLWRFWRHIPRRGKVVMYDRSWYGRVLVERVEGFAKEDAWKRAYHEINDFEEQLVAHGIVVVKLWLAVTKEEQLKRFKEREKLKYKNFKITAEDWRNREKWDDYIVAASDMIDRTSTSHAPWTIVEANDKHLARVKCIEAICERIEATLGQGKKGKKK